MRTESVTSAKFLLALLAVGLTAGAGVAQPYVEDSVDVGGPWVGSLAYNSQADVVYGACWYDSLLFALDCGSLQVISTVYGPMFPGQVVYDATDNKAYCPFPLAPPYFAESLLVVDGNTHTRAGAIRLSGTADLVWSPELNRLYVTFGQSDTVAVLDCRADTVVARIGVGAEPRRPCLNRTEGKLYVFTDEDTAISIVDLGSNTFKGRVYPHIELACSWYAEETGRLYVGGSGGLAEIDGQTDSILRSFNFPGREVAIVGLPELNRLMVATSPPGTYDSVYTIDLTTGEVRARLVVGNMSRRFARSPMTGLVYCVTANPGAVAVIAADGCSVITTLPVGSFPQYVAYSPVHRRVFVSHNN
ncbi:hypothetical protein FJY69_11205, partial [candidate division WOR-3 bacterium]|nr:hypothetical protein [candidate division WOR-3 bacterium]